MEQDGQPSPTRRWAPASVAARLKSSRPKAEGAGPPEVVDPELEALDDADVVEDAQGLQLDRLTDVLLGLQRAPALPLTEPFTVSIAELLLAWADVADQDGFFGDPRVGRVLRLIGGRLAIVVDPDGITVRGLLRRRRVPWERVHALEFAERYQMLRDHVLEGFADDVVRAVRVPVPGLRWLVRKVVGALEHLVPDEEMEHLRDAGGRALVRIDRRGVDVEMRGALGLLTFLSIALSEVLQAEAERRDIEVLS